MNRLTDKAVFRLAVESALDWESSLLDALHPSDEHCAVVRHRIKRLREVQDKYFGRNPDPFRNAKIVTLDELRAASRPAPEGDAP